MADKRIVFYADESLHRKIKVIAAKYGITMKEVLTQALDLWLAEKQKQNNDKI